eukprot:GSMAST32.ASY1.ANO1.1700.1 assembled CDS
MLLLRERDLCSLYQDAKRFLFDTPRSLFPEGLLVETERHGGELVARTLQAHGVKFLFTLVGGHISPLLAESKERGIQCCICCRRCSSSHWRRGCCCSHSWSRCDKYRYSNQKCTNGTYVFFFFFFRTKFCS